MTRINHLRHGQVTTRLAYRSYPYPQLIPCTSYPDPSPHTILRVAAQFEENKMSANNLGIVFGPTLLRPPDGPRAAGASPVTCLLDSGHQAQLVEFLIVHYEQIFGMDELPLATEPLPQDPSPAPGTLTTSPQPPVPFLDSESQSPALALDPDPDPKSHSAQEEHSEATPSEVGACWAHTCGESLISV